VTGALLFTRYRETPLTISREDLLPGLKAWVVEPHGRYSEGRDSAGRRLLHRLPVRASVRGLGLAVERVAEDLDTLELES
jgi:hypothetical protein